MAPSKRSWSPRSRVFAIPSADQPVRDYRPSGRKKEVGDDRTEAQRDIDRITYSKAWRRLSGVTQVVTPFDDTPILHTRLTHSEKVAQVARSIAERLLSQQQNWDLMRQLGGFDADVCIAASLAHDLGHPPFGHIGEQVLDKLALDNLGIDDGFEGNAQTFRCVVIDKLRSRKYEGLDLTYATLAAIAKYPWRRAPTLQSQQHLSFVASDFAYRKHWLKFNAYDPQVDLLYASRSFVPAGYGNEIQTLEASVMDVADDISYAVHDLEDFYLARILDMPAVQRDLEEYHDSPQDGTELGKLADKLSRDYPEWFSSERLQTAANTVAGHLRKGFSRPRDPRGPVEPTAKAEGSDLISKFINNVTLSEHSLWPGGPHIGLAVEAWHEVQILKYVTREYVIRSPDIALLQRGQQEVLIRFVGMLEEWTRKDRNRLPVRLRREISVAEGIESGEIEVGYGMATSAPRGNPKRAILDYVCSLTDAECLNVYYKLSGIQIHRLPTFGI